MASARVRSFRPSGNSIGSSKRRDQDTTQLRKKIDPALFHAVVIQFILGSNDGWGDRRGLEEKNENLSDRGRFRHRPQHWPG